MRSRSGQGGFGGQYETRMSRGSALWDFGRPILAQGHSRQKTCARRYVGLSAIATERRKSLIATSSEKEAASHCSPLCGLEVKITTNGDDAASHSGGPETNRSGGRDRRDGPTHGHGHG